MRRGSMLLFLEALVTSAYVRFSLSFLPFKKVSGWLGKANTENSDNLTPKQLAEIRRVHHILKMCGRYALWKTECYTTALTGKVLLRRRGIPSTLYIGFKKENNKYEGHAWLKTPSGIVTGDMDLTQFQVHSYFS